MSSPWKHVAGQSVCLIFAIGLPDMNTCSECCWSDTETNLKKLVFALATVLGYLLRLLPWHLRRGLWLGGLLVESRAGVPDEVLRHLFSIWDDLDRLISERALAYGGGEHPKHRLTRYHDFFVERIPKGARVLDIGCGYGAVAGSIAERGDGVRVVGIDLNEDNITQARLRYNLPNLEFIHADALKELPETGFDVVVLSNVLEHIEHRVDFLRGVIQRIAPRFILIRLPLFERHWHLPLRRELGIGYFSDPTHYIEHTMEEFHQEMTAAGLVVEEVQTCWGEIWAQCVRGE